MAEKFQASLTSTKAEMTIEVRYNTGRWQVMFSAKIGGIVVAEHQHVSFHQSVEKANSAAAAFYATVEQ